MSLQVPLRKIGTLAHCFVDGVVAHEDGSQACLFHPGHSLPTARTHPVLAPGTPQAKHMLTWDHSAIDEDGFVARVTNVDAW